MSHEIEIKLRGPDRFCPDCGRWLVRVHEDGSFDLAGEAAVRMSAEIADYEAEAHAWEALCYRCEPPT